MGTPVRTPARRPGVVQGLFPAAAPVAAVAVAAVTPPQTIAVAHRTPLTVDAGRKQVILQNLRSTRWYKNPFAISDNSYRHVCSIASNVLKAVLHKEGRYHIQGPPALSGETFWVHLLPLIAGEVHTAKQRVQELVTMMSSNPGGVKQPINNAHPQLQSIHDLPRYLSYMRDTMQKMEMVQGEDVERSKIDKETYVDHIVACVDVYLDGTMRQQYLQRRSRSTKPIFTSNNRARSV
jgi:hypothetical protein